MSHDEVFWRRLLGVRNVPDTQLGEANQASIGNSKFAYFEDVGSSLTLVVVPEPAMLGAVAVLLVGGTLAWRRRA